MKLEDALSRLSAAGLRPAIAPALLATLEDAQQQMRERVSGEVAAAGPASGESTGADAAQLAALDAHVREHLTEIHRLIGGSNWPQFEFVRRRAGASAGQELAIEDTLVAYRLLREVLARWLHNAAAQITSPQTGTGIAAPAAPIDEPTRSVLEGFVTAYIDAVSTLVTTEFVRHARRMSEVGSDRRARELEALLGGWDDTDGSTTELLQRGGLLTPDTRFCVAVLAAAPPDAPASPAASAHRPDQARAPAEGAMTGAGEGPGDGQGQGPVPSPTELDRLTAAALEAITAATDSDVRAARQGDHVVIVALHADAAALAWPLLSLGKTVMAGIGAVATSAGAVPQALEQARVALRHAGGRQRVVTYADIPLRARLLHTAGEGVSESMPAWTGALLGADGRARGKLGATLRAYGDADMNVLKAAKALAVHPNTFYGRLRKIRDLTGLDPIRFADLNELLLALDLAPSHPAAPVRSKRQRKRAADGDGLPTAG
jgi:hypothetical protein